MASVRKRGKGYQITVSSGYRSDGSKILETMTYIPDPGMTLEKLSELYLSDTDPKGNTDSDLMSRTSWAGYRDNLRVRILPHLGHLKIGDIIPKHINDYMKEMRQDGARYNNNVAQDEEHQIPSGATQHHLRHTAASILTANNIDARSVAGVLGHSNPTTTLNIYSYFFKTKNEEAAGIMSNILING